MRHEDMFGKSGWPSKDDWSDGVCADCPYCNTVENICTETEQTVNMASESRNRNCPYVTK